MTVETSEGPAIVTYIRNPQDNTYNITFQYMANDENIRVYLRKMDNTQEDLKLDEDYWIEHTDGNGGVWGVVWITKELKEDVDTTICIYRSLENDQSSTFDSQTLFSDTTERALDKLTMLYQDNQFKQYVIHAPEDDELEYGSLELPISSERANKFLMFDEKGNVSYSEGTDAQENRSLRQPKSEDIDQSFVINIESRKGKMLCFDEEGSVQFREISGATYTAGEGIEFVNNEIITLKASNGSELGGVKAGENINIKSDGTISSTDTRYSAGANVQISENVISSTDTRYSAGEGISINGDNVISTTSSALPIASSTVLGGIKIGNGLSVTGDGTTSAILQIFRHTVFVPGGWQGAKMYQVFINGMLATDSVIADVEVPQGSTTDQTIEILNAWSKIINELPVENGLQFYALEEPGKDLTIRLTIIRGSVPW